MIKQEKINYWLKSAGHDWTVAGHLFEKGDYSYSLFFGHLTIEKLLKAFLVLKFDEQPPFTHRLVYLAEKSNLALSAEQMELLEIITDFNIRARYPDENSHFTENAPKSLLKQTLRKSRE